MDSPVEMRAASNTVLVFQPVRERIVLLPNQQEAAQNETFLNLMYTIKESKILDDVFKFIVSNQIDLLEKLYRQEEPSNHANLSSTLVSMSLSSGTIQKLLKFFVSQPSLLSVQKEFSENEVSGDDTTGEPIYTQITRVYLSKIGRRFLKDLLGPILRQLLDDKKVSLEIDPNKTDPSTIAKNTSALLEKTATLIDSLTSKEMVDKLPQPVKEVAYTIGEISSNKGRQLESIGALLIHDFLIPALYDPIAYNLTNEMPTSRVQRNIHLIGTLLESCVGGQGFPAGNALIDEFVSKRRADLEVYVRAISSGKSSMIGHGDSFTNEISMLQLHTFHRLLYLLKPEFSKIFQEEAKSQEFIKLLEKLPDYQTKMSFSFLTSAEQKGLKNYLKEKNESPCYVTYVDKKKDKGVIAKRVLMIGLNRIATLRPTGKVGREAHLLDLHEIISNTPRQLDLFFKPHRGDEHIPSNATITPFKLILETDDSDDIITCIRRVLEHSLSSVPYTLKPILSVTPVSRLEAIPQPDWIGSEGLLVTYKCLCTYHNLAVNPTICWYLQNTYDDLFGKAFNMKVFTHHTREPPQPQDYIPLLHALRFSWHFDAFIIKGYEHLNFMPLVVAVSEVARNNPAIKSYTLKNTMMKTEGLDLIIESILVNKAVQLTKLDLSNNPLDDKSAPLLAPYLSNSESISNLVELRLAYNVMSQNAIQQVLTSLRKGNPKSLRVLDLSGCKLGTPPTITTLVQFLSNEGKAIHTVSISNTQINFSKFPLNEFARNEAITDLDISNNKVALKEITFFSQLLSNLPSLKKLNLKACGLPDKDKELRELFQAIPFGVTHLILSENPLGVNSVNAMVAPIKSGSSQPNSPVNSPSLSSSSSSSSPLSHSQSLGQSTLNLVSHLHTLILNDTELADQGVAALCTALRGNRSIRILNINSSLKGSLDSKQRIKTVQALSQYVTSDTSLEELYMAGDPKRTNTQLITNIVPFLLTLPQAHSLRLLDISGHSFHNQGAVALAKSLHLNHTLTKLLCDHNHIGTLGIANIKGALKRNTVIQDLPLPTWDISEIYTISSTTDIEKKKLSSLLIKIQQYLHRNTQEI